MSRCNNFYQPQSQKDWIIYLLWKMEMNSFVCRFDPSFIRPLNFYTKAYYSYYNLWWNDDITRIHLGGLQWLMVVGASHTHTYHHWRRPQNKLIQIVVSLQGQLPQTNLFGNEKTIVLSFHCISSGAKKLNNKTVRNGETFST